MASFLFKTEPSSYAYADLVRERRTVWDGVRNPLAIRHLREIHKGDTIAIYHTGEEKRVVGLAAAASEPYPDPKLDDPRRFVIDLKPLRALATPVPLSVFRADALLRDSELVRLPRLSVMPLSAAQFRRLVALSGPKRT